MLRNASQERWRKHRLVFAMRKFLALTLMGASAVSAFATQLPLDPGTGAILFTTNSNDGYSGGRGMWFQANSSFNANGAGFFNQFGGNESFTETLYSADSTGAALHGTVLRSFTVNPATAGTQYDDGLFSSSVGITAGNFYYLEVTSNDAFSGNYFYNWNGSPTVNLGAVTILDGGAGGDPSALSNTVAPVLRLNVNSVPEPASLGVLGLGALALVRRRRSSK